MAFDPNAASNSKVLTINSSKIDASLTDFPVAIDLDNHVPDFVKDDSNTVLLIHSDTTDGSTTFTDSSDSAHAISVNGPYHETDQSKFGGTSIYFDGVNDYLSVSNHTDFDLSSGDWTIDLWFYCTDFSTYNKIILDKGSEFGSTYCQYTINIKTTGELVVGLGEPSSGQTDYSLGVISKNTWYHVAAVMSSGTFYCFLNGVNKVTESSPHSMASDTKDLFIGIVSGGGTDHYFPGYIDEVRIIKGAACWTSAFTPPTAPYTKALQMAIGKPKADSYTKLLIHSDTTDGATTFTDSSDSAHVIMASGNTHHEADQKKFGTTSMYFDGSGDYLSTPDSADWDFGSGDFTIDCWAYISSVTSGEIAIVSQWEVDNLAYIFVLNDGKPQFYCYDGSYHGAVASAALSTGAWHHLAVCRSGATITVYVEGSSSFTIDVTGVTIDDSGSALSVGQQNSGKYFNGYIDELRISKGIARWTANFTPPTAPYDSVQQYYVEIECWETGNHVVHTKIPSISSTVNTNLTLYWDNSQADNVDYVGETNSTPAENVWDSDFVAVYHMAQDPSGTAPQILDSTSNDNDGTSYGSMTSGDLIDGLMGKAISFDGSDDKIHFGNITSSVAQDNVTIDIVATVGNASDWEYLVSKDSTGGNTGDVSLWMSSAEKISIRTITSNNRVVSDTLTVGEEQLISYVYSGGSSHELFMSGVSVSTGSEDTSMWGNSYDLVLAGVESGSGYYFLTDIREFRVSFSARSDAWVKATNASLKDKLFLGDTSILILRPKITNFFNPFPILGGV